MYNVVVKFFLICSMLAFNCCSDGNNLCVDNLFVIRHKGKFGIINRKGRIVLKPQYDFVYPLTNVKYGVVPVRINNMDEKCFIIKDQTLLKSKYITVYGWSGMALVTKKSNITKMLSDNVVQFIFKNSKYPIQCFLIDANHSWIFRSIFISKNKEIIKGIYDYSFPFTESVTPIGIKIFNYRDALWGLINRNGEFVVPYKYKQILPYKNGYAFATKTDGKCVIINTNGLVLTALKKFHPLAGYSEGLFLMSSRVKILPYQHEFYSNNIFAYKEIGKRIYCDIQGRIVLKEKSQIRFEGPFNNGLAAFSDKKTKKFGYINKFGVIVIPPDYYNAYSFKSGLARVITKNGKWAYINTNNQIIWQEK